MVFNRRSTGLVLRQGLTVTLFPAPVVRSRQQHDVGAFRGEHGDRLLVARLSPAIETRLAEMLPGSVALGIEGVAPRQIYHYVRIEPADEGPISTQQIVRLGCLAGHTRRNRVP